MTIDADIRGWLVAARCPGLPPGEARRLVERMGGAHRLADPSSLPAAALDALRPEVRQALVSDGLAERVREEADAIERAGWTILHPADPGYPVLLGHLTDAPVILAVAGHTDLLAGPAVAIAGRRRPSGYGLRMARDLAAGLAAVGVVVVSGLARGIDAAAHEAALDAGGLTVAVMGTGLDAVYPACHRRLARRIRPIGALVSEFPPGTPVQPYNFPRRNRIIAGLADAVVVVEAAKKSGSLITAGIGLGLGRAVLAVPGRVGDETSEGTLALLHDGAALACTVADVLMELPPARCPGLVEAARAAAPGPPPVAVVPGDPLATEVLALFPRDDELQVDAILGRVPRGLDEVMEALFTLQMNGLIEALPGGHFRRSAARGDRSAV